MCAASVATSVAVPEAVQIENEKKSTGVYVIMRSFASGVIFIWELLYMYIIHGKYF